MQEPFRRKTSRVLIGSIGVGSSDPIRIQSMTTTPTDSVEKTVDQIMRLNDAGCEIVRVTVQGKKEARACQKIKDHLIQKGYTVPIVADIHFYPPAALEVIEYVDKVRINPGNFLDKRAQFKTIFYENAKAYEGELLKIEEGFSPLVLKTKALGKAMRIGVNHGSLSDRIMSRYGDTPIGMVESAIEYAKVCVKNDFHNFLFSMKSSNPKIMIEAYQLLVKKMDQLGWAYPLHLGVTEAGMGEDGRVKSALGIGTLLLSGIGDTIRVSLTEDPVDEILPAKQIVKRALQYKALSYGKKILLKQTLTKPAPIFNKEGVVCVIVSKEDIEKESFYLDIGCKQEKGTLIKTYQSVDILFYRGSQIEKESISKLESVKRLGVEVLDLDNDKTFTFIEDLDGFEIESVNDRYVILKTSYEKIEKTKVVSDLLSERGIPFIFYFTYNNLADAVIQSAIDIGSYLITGYGNGLMVDGFGGLKERVSLMFCLLQACRKRDTKTDYIACPGCGRTLFDLQDVTKAIQEKTRHLPGVKIAIMGCIVNGPGEMADADFGYVGSKSGHVDLYIGKTCVEKMIPSEIATEKLIALIKSEGKWVEP